MSNLSKIGIGTVQWGMIYGINNVTGKPDVSEIRKIVAHASMNGISLIDTAHAYGDSEKVIGSLGSSLDSFNIVTKTLPIHESSLSESDISRVKQCFKKSLALLMVEKVYALLVHHVQDLVCHGGEYLWDLLEELKQSRLATKIGVSVYDPEELDAILERFDVDVVQLPFNIYDQRFLLTGALQELKKRKVEIHSRSAFLQGLLLMDASRLPEWFHSVRCHQARLHEFILDSGSSPLAVCANYCLSQTDIDYTIVGVETNAQLQQILSQTNHFEFDSEPFKEFAVDNRDVINPSRWNT